jgi:hypothetical protein
MSATSSATWKSSRMSAAPSAAIVVLSGYGPERLDPAITGEVAAHLPKTTDLDTVRRTLRAAGNG